MSSTGLKDYGLVALTGFGTGFLWSALAGEADLKTGEGWLRTIVGGAGSSLNSTSIFALSDFISEDKNLAWKITGAWFGIQSATGLTNTIGNRLGIYDNSAYQAISFPLNYMSAPLLSTIGLLWGFTGEVACGFGYNCHVFFRNGILFFEHELQSTNVTTVLGAVGNGTTWGVFGQRSLILHERGHMMHVSIMGDIGSSLFFPSALIIEFFISGFDISWDTYGNSFFENWADDFANKVQWY